jgi:hypothetical protein
MNAPWKVNEEVIGQGVAVERTESGASLTWQRGFHRATWRCHA